MIVKISAVIITFNEERNIVRCLDSIENLVDEIVVVDSFSTDETENLCRAFGVRFIKHAFDGYIEQRNWAADQAGSDYILALDADEVISDNLRASILAVKNNWQADAYTFNRLTNYMGKWIRHSGWYPDVKLRLYDRRKGKSGGVNPHDKVSMQAGCQVVKIKGDLLHFSYYSTRQHLNQINTFTEISSNAAFKSGKKSSLFIAILKSVWKFKRDYFFKLGFLDGSAGFIVCYFSAHTTFVKYLKLRELKKAGK